MKDGIVVFDAPTGEGQSRWVIDAAKAKYPTAQRASPTGIEATTTQQCRSFAVPLAIVGSLPSSARLQFSAQRRSSAGIARGSSRTGTSGHASGPVSFRPELSGVGPGPLLRLCC